MAITSGGSGACSPCWQNGTAEEEGEWAAFSQELSSPHQLGVSSSLQNAKHLEYVIIVSPGHGPLYGMPNGTPKHNMTGLRTSASRQAAPSKKKTTK